MHGVHMIFNGERGGRWEAGQLRQSRIVFIGKNLNAEEINGHFMNCRADTSSSSSSSSSSIDSAASSSMGQKSKYE
jgi:hypothetical protein